MRIASLLPGATEILCALGLREHLVAISHECDYPADVLILPRVSSTSLSSALDCATIDELVVGASNSGEQLNLLDAQRLRDLDADLIVSQSLCDVCAIDTLAIQAALPQNGNTGIIGLEGSDFEGILNDIRALAQVTSTGDVGARLCDSLLQRWQATQAELPGSPPRVLFVEWSEPGYYAGHWVPQMIVRAGGVDICGVAGQRSGVFQWAQVRKREPQVIVFGCCGFGLQRNSEIAESFCASQLGEQMLLGADGGVWAVDANAYFSRPGPRIIEGLQALAWLLRGSETEGVSRRIDT